MSDNCLCRCGDDEQMETQCQCSDTCECYDSCKSHACINYRISSNDSLLDNEARKNLVEEEHEEFILVKGADGVIDRDTSDNDEPDSVPIIAYTFDENGNEGVPITRLRSVEEDLSNHAINLEDGNTSPVKVVTFEGVKAEEVEAKTNLPKIIIYQGSNDDKSDEDVDSKVQEISHAADTSCTADKKQSEEKGDVVFQEPNNDLNESVDENQLDDVAKPEETEQQINDDCKMLKEHNEIDEQQEASTSDESGKGNDKIQPKEKSSTFQKVKAFWNNKSKKNDKDDQKTSGSLKKK